MLWKIQMTVRRKIGHPRTPINQTWVCVADSSHDAEELVGAHGEDVVAVRTDAVQSMYLRIR